MKIVKTIKNIFNATIKDDCLGMAAEMAFNFILSLFPFLISATAVFGLLGSQGTINKIIHSIKTFAPVGALNLVEQVLKEIIHPASGGVLTISFIIGIFIASNALYVLIKVLNKAYGVPETRSFWKIRALSLLVIFIFILAAVFVTNVVILGNIILDFIHNHFYFDDSLLKTIILAKWPIAFMALCITGFIIYYVMPNITASFKIRFMSSLPGTIFFTIVWLLFSRLFGLYVENFSVFNKVYGTLGAFMVLLLWLYYTSLVILIGGEINSEVYKQIKTREN